MSTSPEPSRDQMDDLLIQQAIHGLTSEERTEMDELLRQFQQSDDDRYESAVGALDSGFSGLEQNVEANTFRLPESLRSLIIAEAAPHITKFGESPGDLPYDEALSRSSTAVKPQEDFQKRSQSRSLESRSSWSTREKWFSMVTAASSLLALDSFSGLFSKPPIDTSTVKALTVVEQLEQFQSTGLADLRTVSWTNPTDDPASADASGEVLWSDSAQKGFMVFNDLQVNKPTEAQYQLWIFDAKRDDKLPVDGGVFDIDSEGRVIVPIDAKLAITEAKMFAVTIEIPGGVVKSERKRLPLLASITL